MSVFDEHKKTGYVAHIRKFMLNDGPGIRSVVFLKGCRLRCMWCNSPQTWEILPKVIFLKKKCIGCGKCLKACAENAIDITSSHRVNYKKCTGCGKCADACPSSALRFDGYLMTVGEVIKEVLKDISYYKSTVGGVTLSGGEASLQTEFAMEILKKCTENRIHTALETSGYVEWEKLKRLTNWTKILYYDIKHMDSNEHKKLTGQRNELILKNIEKVAKLSLCEIVINLPLIPGLNDGLDNIAALANFMKKLFINKIRILPFNKLGKHEYDELGIEYLAEKILLPSTRKLAEIKQLLNDKDIMIVEE